MIKELLKAYHTLTHHFWIRTCMEIMLSWDIAVVDGLSEIIEVVICPLNLPPWVREPDVARKCEPWQGAREIYLSKIGHKIIFRALIYLLLWHRIT